MNSRGTPSCMASARMPPVLVPAITWKSSRIRLPVRLSSSLSICSVRRPLRPPPSRESTAMVGCATSCDEGEHDGLPSMATALVRERGLVAPRVAKFGVIWHHPHGQTEADVDAILTFSITRFGSRALNLE